MSYEKLLEELNGIGRSLNKAMAAAPIPTDVDGNGEEEEGEDDGAEGQQPPAMLRKGSKKGAMSKALNVTLESGEQVTAFDGSELVGALMQRTEGMHTALSKALSVVEAVAKRNLELEGTVSELQKSLAAIGDSGTGRKSVVQMIGGDPSGADTSKKGVTAAEFMTKSISAMRAGRITGGDVTRINALVNNGKEIPADLVDKVLSA